MATVRTSKTGIDVEDIKGAELYGVLLRAAGEAAPLDDSVILQKLFAAEDFYERDLQISFRQARVFSDAEGRATHPDLSLRVTDFDETVDLSEPGYDYNNRLWDEERWAFIRVGYAPVRSVSQLVFTWPGAWKVWSVPHDWIRVGHRFGMIQIAPTSGQAVLMTFTAYILGVISGGRGLPQSIILDYTTGFTPELLEARHQDLLEGVRLRTLLSLGGIISTIRTGGQTGGSLGLDGLSESRTFGGKFGAYSALIELALEREKEVRDAWRHKEHGVIMGVLGAQ